MSVFASVLTFELMDINFEEALNFLLSHLVRVAESKQNCLEFRQCKEAHIDEQCPASGNYNTLIYFGQINGSLAKNITI